MADESTNEMPPSNVSGPEKPTIGRAATGMVEAVANSSKSATEVASSATIVAGVAATETLNPLTMEDLDNRRNKERVSEIAGALGKTEADLVKGSDGSWRIGPFNDADAKAYAGALEQSRPGIMESSTVAVTNVPGSPGKSWLKIENPEGIKNSDISKAEQVFDDRMAKKIERDAPVVAKLEEKLGVAIKPREMQSEKGGPARQVGGYELQMPLNPRQAARYEGILGGPNNGVTGDNGGSKPLVIKDPKSITPEMVEEFKEVLTYDAAARGQIKAGDKKSWLAEMPSQSVTLTSDGAGKDVKLLDNKGEVIMTTRPGTEKSVPPEKMAERLNETLVGKGERRRILTDDKGELMIVGMNGKANEVTPKEVNAAIQEADKAKQPMNQKAPAEKGAAAGPNQAGPQIADLKDAAGQFVSGVMEGNPSKMLSAAMEVVQKLAVAAVTNDVRNTMKLAESTPSGTFIENITAPQGGSKGPAPKGPTV